MNMRTTNFILSLMLFSGCIPSALQMANNEADTAKRFLLPSGVIDYGIEVKIDDFERYTFNNQKLLG